MDISDRGQTFAAQDAADALIALGWPATPPSWSQPRRQIGNDLMTATELLVFAAFVVIVPKKGRARR